MKYRTMQSLRRLRRLLCPILLVWHAAGCGGTTEPNPTVTLTISGTVTADENPTVPIPGATVELRKFKGVLTNPVTHARRQTDEAGQYTLQYTYTSICTEGARQSYWVNVSADGYDPQSTFTGPGYDFDPPIYCREQTQTFDFALQRTPGGSAPDS